MKEQLQNRACLECFQLQAIRNVNFYYNANKVGTLPQSVTNDVDWVQSSLLQEATAGPLGRDMSGGWLTWGAAFATKNTIPSAFTVAMLAWSLIRYRCSPPLPFSTSGGAGFVCGRSMTLQSVRSFPNGFKASGSTQETLDNIRWGADYLLKTVDNGAVNADVVYQMGNLTVESQNWQRPWDITNDRPYYALTQAAAGADLLGPVVGALAASAIALGKEADEPYYNTLLSTAQQVYSVAAVNARGAPL